MAAHQAPPSLGFSRQEHWSGLPFPSPVHESEKWKWSHSVVSDSSRPHWLQPTRLLSMGFSRQEYWSGSPVPSPESLSIWLLRHFSCVWLLATLWTAASQAPLSIGISQARTLEPVSISSCRWSSWLRDQTCISLMSPTLTGWFFTFSTTWEALGWYTSS